MSEPRAEAGRDVVDRYERDIAMPADVQERIAARLAASIARDVEPVALEEPRPHRWRSPRMIWMGVGAAAAAMLLLWAGLRATTGQQTNDPNGMSAPHQRSQPDDPVQRAVPRNPEARAGMVEPSAGPRTGEAVEPPTPLEPPERDLRPDSSEDPEEDPEEDSADSPKRSPSKRSEATDGEPKRSPAGASSLQPELASLEAVRRSLREDPPATALTRATAHRDAFPEGLLAREARALEIIARCRVGQRERGRAAARAFAEAFPASTLVPRIDEACTPEETD